MQTYQELKAKEHAALVVAASYAEEAEATQRLTVKSKGMEGWLGYRFESSSGLTEEFAAFSRQARRELAKMMQGYKLIGYSRNHFEFSAFLQNERTGKLVYVSCSDVRFFPDAWYKNLLIRTARHDKDYTGGSNCYATWPTLRKQAESLTV